MALVTDAGTPLVSDPGDVLVGAWIAAGGTWSPSPVPRRSWPRWWPRASPRLAGASRASCRARAASARSALARIAADDRATVLFEAHGRTAATLRDLAGACGEERRAVCRELTKLHEEVRRGTLGELALASPDAP